MINRARMLRPYGSFFAAGQYGRGSWVMVLQLTLVFWPLAVKMARNFDEARSVQEFLDTLSARYPATAAAPKLTKRFRQPEMAENQG